MGRTWPKTCFSGVFCLWGDVCPTEVLRPDAEWLGTQVGQVELWEASVTSRY